MEQRILFFFVEYSGEEPCSFEQALPTEVFGVVIWVLQLVQLSWSWQPVSFPGSIIVISLFRQNKKGQYATLLSVSKTMDNDIPGLTRRDVRLLGFYGVIFLNVILLSAFLNS